MDRWDYQRANSLSNYLFRLEDGMSTRVPRIVGAGWRSKSRTGKVERIQIAFTKENIVELLQHAQAQLNEPGAKYAYFDIYPNTRRMNDRAPELNMVYYTEGQPGEDDILAQAGDILNGPPNSATDQN